jgi:hypothetical protein
VVDQTYKFRANGYNKSVASWPRRSSSTGALVIKCVVFSLRTEVLVYAPWSTSFPTRLDPRTRLPMQECLLQLNTYLLCDL